MKTLSQNRLGSFTGQAWFRHFSSSGQDVTVAGPLSAMAPTGWCTLLQLKEGHVTGSEVYREGIKITHTRSGLAFPLKLGEAPASAGNGSVNCAGHHQDPVTGNKVMSAFDSISGIYHEVHYDAYGQVVSTFIHHRRRPHARPRTTA